YFYRMKSEVWARSNNDLVDPVRVASYRKLLLVNDLLPRGWPEAEVAGQPLFVCERQLNRLIRGAGAVSRKALSITGHAIVSDYLSEHPTTPMQRDEFVRRMQTTHRGASGRQVLEVWTENAPESWKKAGRSRENSRKEGFDSRRVRRIEFSCDEFF